MWESKVDDKPLTFHLSGINNQNFIMRDEETGSWWQQVTGEAIQGPMKGRRLNAVFCDELTFATWKREHPEGRVLKPDEKVAAKYEAENWEEEYANFPVVTPTDAADQLKPRTLIVGVELNGASKAYPLESLQQQQLILDELGGVPLFVLIGEDRKSVRAFERRLDGRTLEFFVVTEGEKQQPPSGGNRQLIDAETGSIWDFSGRCQHGQLAGKQLKPIPVLKDYWFDWKIYHPKTAIYLLGERLKQ
ncbi:MAG: DUF3179 domain-containing protein [Acidobacteria bacterium]|nr:DUF3179 domain-containing protein [Acidobacteriota bacterium]